MNTALTFIAESVVKAVGVAGIEAMAMKKAITLVWNPIAAEFADEVLKAVIVGDQVRPERAENVMASYRLRMTTDFVDAVAPAIEEYVGYAYDRGKEYILSNAIAGVLDPILFKVEKSAAAGVRQHRYDLQDRIHAGFLGRREVIDQPSYPENVMLQKDQASIITDLVSITGSTKKNVQRTITRWFKDTQGQYFDRFIVPETARLMSYADTVEGNVTSLAKVGKDYKKFVEADAYWASVSEFNAESSKVWAQMQTLHEVGVDTYTLVAVIDNKTCPVCLHLNGTSWSVQQAISKIYDMLIMESEEAYAQNPFPPRSTPKDYPDPKDSPFELPPFHPRCRCNVRSEFEVTQSPGEVIARPFDAKKPPTDKSLTKVFNTYITKMSKKEVEAAVKAGDRYIPAHARALTGKEWGIVKEGFEDIPLEIRKWAERNRENYRILITDAEGFSSRVYGNTILLNSRFVADDVGTQVIQHELRHALINKPIMQASGGGDTIWNDILNRSTKDKFSIPVHMNKQYALNGGRGVIAGQAAGDEFLAMIGDYYTQGISLEDLVKVVRTKGVGIEVATKTGQIVVGKKAAYWSAKEAKKAVSYWWALNDVDNLSMMTTKQMLAKSTHLPMSATKLRIATQNELRLRDLLREAGIADVFQEGDRRPYDVWIGADPIAWYEKLPGRKKPSHLIEVKSIIEAKNNKITMHGDSLARKKLEWHKMGKKKTKASTVVFDERTGKLYYKPGVGSYRLSAMREVTTGELQEIFGGKATETLVEAVAEKEVQYMQITTRAQYNVFRANMELVKDEHRKFLDWYTWEEYKEKGIRIYMSQDGQTGYGISKNNMGVTLWTRADATPGIGKKSIAHGITQGMDKLECYDGKLPTIYEKFGFKEVSRTPWNDAFAPKHWDYAAYGKPDYLEMKLPPKKATLTQYTGRDIAKAKYNQNRSHAAKYFRDNDYEEVVKAYTESDDVYHWNATLRRSKTFGEAIEDIDEGLGIEVLYDAIDGAPKFDGTVYRGIRFPHKLKMDQFEDKIFDAMKSGDVLEWKGFTSTSFDKLTAREFMDRNNAPFKIMVQVQTREGVVLEALSKWGVEEKEVLLNAYSRFKVKSFKKLKDGTYMLKLDQVSYKPVGYVSEVAPAAERAALKSRRSPKKWKWEEIPIGTQPRDAKAAAVKFEQWMADKGVQCFFDVTDNSFFKPPQTIKMVNQIAEELTRVQNANPNLAHLFKDKLDIGFNRIVAHPGKDLRMMNLDDTAYWMERVANAKNQGDGVLGLHWPEYGNPLEGFHEDLLVFSVNTSDELWVKGAKVGRLERGRLTIGGGSFHTITDGGALDTISHEMGHAVFEVVNSSDDYRSYKEQFIKIYNKHHKQDRIAYGVSQYADTDYDEFFAEAFAARMHPDYGINEIHRFRRELDDFFDDLLRTGKSVGKAVDEEALMLADLDALEARFTIAEGPSTPASTLKKKGSIDQGNVNEVQIVTIGKGKKRYIYKPIEGESYYAPQGWREARREIQSKFGVTVNSLEDIEPSHWAYLENELDITPQELWIRQTVTNTSVSLAEREAFALDVAHELGFDNDYAIVPKYSWAVDDAGERSGILIEFIRDAEVQSAFFGRELWDEERFQMAVFDYLIGNTDRHESNWMRKIAPVNEFGESITPVLTPSGKPAVTKIGRPVYIDHGYSMPGQELDTGGLAEFRAMEVGTGSGGREIYAQMEWDLDPDYLEGMITRLQRFADDEVDEIVKQYGFVSDEVEALQYRADALVEHLRGGTFAELMVKHREVNGLWGLEDSFIQ